MKNRTEAIAALDVARRTLNLAGAVAQIAASAWVSRAGAARFSEPAPGGDPPIVPMGYAFSIWGPIFAGSLAYAVYQALPPQGARTLLRRMGWATALAFACTTAWPLVAQDPELEWATVALLATIAAALGLAVREIVRERAERGAPFSRGDRWLVVAPVSVFLGWATVATFANVGTALRQAGVTAPGAAEAGLTLVMLAAVTGLAAWATVASRGNAWFAATVVWGLVAITVANASGWRREQNLVVAGAAVVCTVVVAAALRLGRREARQPRGTSAV